MYEGGELERWARRRVRDREAQSIREMQPLDDDSDASEPTPKPAPARPRKASDPPKAKVPEEVRRAAPESGTIPPPGQRPKPDATDIEQARWDREIDERKRRLEAKQPGGEEDVPPSSAAGR
jgi:hypothetical protein